MVAVPARCLRHGPLRGVGLGSVGTARKVAALAAAQLDRWYGEWQVVDCVTGAAARDLHHAVQINLVKRLIEAAMDKR